MNRRILIMIALLLTVSLGAMAQTSTDGRKVKRITFDQEQVNIEYADGTTELETGEVIIVNDGETTEVKTVKTTKQNAKRRWYTTDGRALKGEPREKGVYIVIEENGMKKTIRK